MIVHLMMRNPKHFMIGIYDSDENDLEISSGLGISKTHKENDDNWIERVNEWVKVYNRLREEGVRGKEAHPHVQNNTYARIDQGIYKDSILQSSEIMALDSERNTDDIRAIIERYFNIDSFSLLIFTDHSGHLTTDGIRDCFSHGEEDVNE